MQAYMTFNKLQTLNTFQSIITATRGLERHNFDLNSLSYIPRNLVESSPSNSWDSVRSSTLCSNLKLWIIEAKKLNSF